MGDKVLVTGATGFVGRAALAALHLRGHDVVGASRTADERANVVACDLLDPAQVDALIETHRPTHLLHLAWDVTHGRYWAAPSNLVWLRASLLLLERFVAAGGRRAVVAGTCAEYNWSYGYCSEDVTPYAPATLYGVAKAALRDVMTGFSAEQGLSAAWGHVFFPYGPGESAQRLVGGTISSLLRGEPARCSAGTQLRDYQHVADTGDALAALLCSDVVGAVNIASGQPVAVATVVTEIARQLGCPELLQLGALPSRPGDPPLVVGDVRKLTEQVSWKPRFGLQAGIADTIAWWRDRLGSQGE